MKYLFLGDSHTAGYSMQKGNAIEWGENNYAELFNASTGIPTIICANPGVGNYKYAEWVKALLDIHDNIEKVFIQSTYWNRFRICASRNLDFGFDEYTVGHFLQQVEADIDNTEIIRYNDLKIKDNFVEMQLKPGPHIYESFKGFKVDNKLEDSPKDITELSEEYMYTKVWHEMQTQMQYIEYSKDMFIIDRICAERNIECFVWRMNDRCGLPNNLNMFGELKNVNVVRTSAEDFIYSNFSIDCKQHTIDEEHYNINIHQIIAESFIPWVING
jgi:hypothetical protein